MSGLPPGVTRSSRLLPWGIANSISEVLLGVLLMQVLLYMRAGFRDKKLLKTAVVALMVLGVIDQSLLAAAVAIWSIRPPSEYDNWDTRVVAQMHCLFFTLNTAICQSFFIQRTYNSWNKHPAVLICLYTLFAMALTGGLGIFAAGLAIRETVSQISEPHHIIVIFLFMWQLGTLFCDVSASGLLCYRLFKTRKGFNTSTDSVLMSLFRISLSTASLAAIWALIDLVTYLTLAGAPPYNETFSLLLLTLPRIHAISVLYTLLARSSLRQGISQTQLSGAKGVTDQLSRRSTNVSLTIKCDREVCTMIDTESA